MWQKRNKLRRRRNGSTRDRCVCEKERVGRRDKREKCFMHHSLAASHVHRLSECYSDAERWAKCG
jgi:hypothetical protein